MIFVFGGGTCIYFADLSTFIKGKNIFQQAIEDNSVPRRPTIDKSPIIVF